MNDYTLPHILSKFDQTLRFKSDDPCVSSIVAANVKIKHLGDNAF